MCMDWFFVLNRGCFHTAGNGLIQVHRVMDEARCCLINGVTSLYVVYTPDHPLWHPSGLLIMACLRLVARYGTHLAYLLWPCLRLVTRYGTHLAYLLWPCLRPVARYGTHLAYLLWPCLRPVARYGTHLAYLLWPCLRPVARYGTHLAYLQWPCLRYIIFYWDSPLLPSAK